MESHGTRRAPLQMTQVFHGIPWNIPWNSMELWCRQMTYQLVPWNSMEYSMEFHGTLVPPNDISLSSMEFHGTFHGTLVPPNEVSLSSMEFHGTLRLSFYDLLPWASKEYSTEFHGILESPNKKKSPRSMGFHGIRRAPFQMTHVPWNSMLHSMEVWCRHMKYHLVPWNCMELWDCHFIQYHATLDFHEIYHGIPWNFPFDLEKFHGIPWNSMELLASSMEFHGIPWNCEILILINFIIGEVYFIVSCMISCHCISDNPLVVEILRYFNSKATFWCPSFWLNGGIPF